MSNDFNAGSFIGRWLFAALLVFGTYNATHYSYIDWAFMGEGTEFGPEHGLVGILLLTGWIVFLRATFLSIGWLGMLLGAGFCACVVWLLVEQGWVNLESPNNITWVIQITLTTVLAIGMSWAHIRRRMSGQLSVDDVEDDN